MRSTPCYAFNRRRAIGDTPTAYTHANGCTPNFNPGCDHSSQCYSNSNGCTPDFDSDCDHSSQRYSNSNGYTRNPNCDANPRTTGALPGLNSCAHRGHPRRAYDWQLGANRERESENTLPSGYFEYLRDLNVNWVGVSVGLHYDDSMDSSVERRYSGVEIPTFTDEFLREVIRAFHQHGICVYLTLAFEAHEAEEAERLVYRWWLGNPIQDQWEPNILPEFWPWAIGHPDHERFVAEFWETYTGQAVHFGQLAEEEGVALYSLGTETEGLFRTRPSDQLPNDFGEELRVMVAAVREVYSGPLTYDMHYSAFTSSEVWGPGSDHLWEDLGLDVIGLSAYFPLVDSSPTRVLSVEELEKSWEAIFQDYLIPLQAANPDRPIYFTEFGAADSVRSPHQPNIDNFTFRRYEDADENGLDDGEETQANIYQALFNVMDRHPGVVNGAFLWEMWMADDEQWAVWGGRYRSNSVRGVLAEDVVRAYYGAAPRDAG